MSIDRLIVSGRRQIVWYDVKPPDDVGLVFKNRGLPITICRAAELHDPAYLIGIGAVVFVQAAAKPLKIIRDIDKETAIRLLDYDCRIFVFAESDAENVLVRTISQLDLPTGGSPLLKDTKSRSYERNRDGLPPTPHVRVLGPGISWINGAQTIADFLSEHPAGIAPNLSLTITVSDRTHWNESRELLVRRAFHDCSEVYLTTIRGGKSSAAVYLAHGVHSGDYGQWPQPYFVKIDDRERIITEYVHYQEDVDPYVPFHLTPNLILERCCLGANQGIIVGDYVEESETLLHCARDGRSAQAIACLFDRALRGWYRDAKIQSLPLTKYINLPKRIDESRIDLARELGATKNLVQLRNLFSLCTPQPLLVGPIHGDLNANNIRVRATDSVVIDFFAHRNGALVYDAACLEASLLIDGFKPDDQGGIEWLRSIRQLYLDFPLLDSPIHCHPTNLSSWLYASAWQIRLYARQMERTPHQYEIALAAALLMKASKDPEVTGPEAFRRAAAYMFGDLILTHILEPQHIEA